MKTATLPSLRIEPEVREAAESVALYEVTVQRRLDILALRHQREDDDH